MATDPPPTNNPSPCRKHIDCTVPKIDIDQFLHRRLMM